MSEEEKPKTEVRPAPKPAKPPAPPDPREEAARTEAEAVKTAIEKAIGADVVEEMGASKTVPILRIRREKWLEAVRFLRDDPDHLFNYAELFTGADYPDYLEVVLYLQSIAHGRLLSVKTRAPRDDAEVPSLTPLYPGVNWEEREVYDLLGVRFAGHPDLRRIMLADDWNGYPLRKDYSDFENVSKRGGEPL